MSNLFTVCQRMAHTMTVDMDTGVVVDSTCDNPYCTGHKGTLWKGDKLTFSELERLRGIAYEYMMSKGDE